MVAIQIRDVPDDVRDALAARASEEGQSLQNFLLGVVVREASFMQNRAIIAELAEWTMNTPATADDALAALETARAERSGAA